MLQLSVAEREELLAALIASIDGDPEGTPEEIARPWEEEIARRIADHDAGRTKEIPADEVFARVRSMITRLRLKPER
jgi:putative addiction module component (TIGR02574 family)